MNEKEPVIVKIDASGCAETGCLLILVVFSILLLFFMFVLAAGR